MTTGDSKKQGGAWLWVPNALLETEAPVSHVLPVLRMVFGVLLKAQNEIAEPEPGCLTRILLLPPLSLLSSPEIFLFFASHVLLSGGSPQKWEMNQSTKSQPTFRSHRPTVQFFILLRLLL